MDIGSAAFDDLVKKAVKRAGCIPLNVLIGEMPLNFKNRGNTINP